MTGNQYAYVDLTSSTVYQNPAGTANLKFGPWIAGQTIVYTLRFLQRQLDGSVLDIGTNVQRVRALRVGIGNIDRRPDSGEFSIQVNGFRSEKFDWDASAREIQDRLNDVLPFNVFCDDSGGSIEIQAEDGRLLELQIDCSELLPSSGSRIHSIRVRGKFIYYFRLVQLPVAFTDFSNQVVADPPSVREIQEGYTSGDGITRYPEIQALYVPPDFENVYQLLLPGTLKRTRLLNKNDGVAVIESALKAVIGSVSVTNPLDNIAYIEFNKENNGINYPNLEVLVPNPAPPDLRFSINLNTAELYSLLRDRESVTLPFEAEMLVDVNPNDSSEGTALVKLWKTEVVISRPLIWEGMASVAPIGWQSRAYPTDYIPFTRQQSIVGQQQAYVAEVGDGVASEFFIDHNLGGVFRGESIVSSTPVGGGTSFRVLTHKLVVGAIITISGHSVNKLNGTHGVKEVIDANQFIVSELSASAGVGGHVSIRDGYDGALEGIDFYTKLGVQNIVLRENKASGKVIKDGFDVYFITASTLKVVFKEAPAPGEYIAIIIGYGPTSAFLSHTHPIDAVQHGGERLRDILEKMQESIDRLFQLIPRNLVQVASGLPPAAVKIPTFGEILPDLALVQTDTGTTASIASQLVAETQKNKPPEVIAGTDLEKKKKELEAELESMKMKAQAEINAAREAAKESAKAAEEKAKQEAAAKQVVSNISKVKIGGFGVRPGNPTLPWANLWFPEKRGAKFPWLLPAIHSNLPIGASQVPDLAAAAGKVYINSSASVLILPGGGGRKAQSVAPGAFFGSDGRAIYALSKGLNENTFYPLEMERTLIKSIVSKAQFPVNSSLTMRWDTSADLQGYVDGGCSCVMLVELRPIIPQSNPAPTGENTGIVGAGIVIAAPRINFSLNSIEARNHYLKLERKLPADGIYSSASSFFTYGTDAAGPGFSNEDFVLSVALVRWDVDDSSSSPLGSVGFYMKDTEISVDVIS